MTTTKQPRRSLRWSDMPFRGRVLRDWFIALAVMVAVTSAIGFLILGPLEGSVVALDRDIAQSLGEMRTPDWNDSTAVGSTSADSLVKIPGTIVLSLLFLWRWRRWREAGLLVGALALESSAFVITSFIVDRSRPPIEQLDSIPPTGSFPSGHTGAAVAFYGALAVIVWWHVRNPLVRGVVALIAGVLPFVVGFSRMYRGMHFLSDVVVGGIVGLVALVIVYRLLGGQPPGQTEP